MAREGRCLRRSSSYGRTSRPWAQDGRPGPLPGLEWVWGAPYSGSMAGPQAPGGSRASARRVHDAGPGAKGGGVAHRQASRGAAGL